MSLLEIAQKLEIAAKELEEAEAVVDEKAAVHASLQHELAAYAGVSTKKKTPTSNPMAPKIREWAKAHKVKCPDRGRIPHEVTEKYHAAMAKSSAGSK